MIFNEICILGYDLVGVLGYVDISDGGFVSVIVA